MQTPYYLINEQFLENDVDLLLNSFKGSWTNHICSYSVKTNSLPWILAYLKKKGFYAEIVSESEYCLVRKIGFENNKIIYNGPVKNKKIIETLLLNDGLVNIDSHDEIGFLLEIAKKNPTKHLKIGIRVNCDFKKLTDLQLETEQEESRFGFSYYNGEFFNLIKSLRHEKNIEIIGLHLHTETKQRSIEGYKALVNFAHKISQEHNFFLKYVDIGGGFFGGLKNRPTFADYIPEISKEMKKNFDENKTSLIVEPGVSLIAHSTLFYTTVKDVKQIDNTIFIVTDGSRLNLNPLTKQKSYLHHTDFIDTSKRNIIEKQVICGYTCMESDRLFEIMNEQELKCGDRIIYENAGAYTICLTPLFINYFPAIYVQKKDGSLYIAREEWTLDEYMAKNHYEI
ncbi:MAG: hypothetical protein ACTTHG_01190 [Treponemataceae bacterium]